MKKYKIGYTTGVYDMFHIGHLNILKRAKEICDYLIVGVSTDELVKSYKNKTPMIPFNERCAIVESCRYVDRVVAQENMDKINAWKNLNFNVMFHGDEWKGSDLYNKYVEDFNNIGVEVVFLEHTKGISSSIILEKLNEESK